VHSAGGCSSKLRNDGSRLKLLPEREAQAVVVRAPGCRHPADEDAAGVRDDPVVPRLAADRDAAMDPDARHRERVGAVAEAHAELGADRVP
jgi:hypothetical protein